MSQWGVRLAVPAVHRNRQEQFKLSKTPPCTIPSQGWPVYLSRKSGHYVLSVAEIYLSLSTRVITDLCDNGIATFAKLWLCRKLSHQKWHSAKRLAEVSLEVSLSEHNGSFCLTADS